MRISQNIIEFDISSKPHASYGVTFQKQMNLIHRGTSLKNAVVVLCLWDSFNLYLPFFKIMQLLKTQGP